MVAKKLYLFKFIHRYRSDVLYPSVFFKKKSLRFTTGLLDLPPYIDIGHSDSCDKRD